jgi:hypothetical protein
MPGKTVYFTELYNKKDLNTISDTKGEIFKALNTNNLVDIGTIVSSIYKNAKYKGALVDDKGKIKIINNGILYPILVVNTGSTLKVSDTLNRKETIIEYKSSVKKEVDISFQDQLMIQFKKRKMNNKEVIDYLKEMVKGFK